MIRQAHTYLVGAMGGATLIAIAIAVFVLLVSAQVFRDWPIAALGDGGGESAEVSKARPAGVTGPGAEGASSDGAIGAPAGAAANGRQAGSRLQENGGSVAAGGGIGTAGGGGNAADPGGPGDAAGGGGGPGGNAPPPANSSSPSGANGSSSSGGGGKAGGGSSSSPSGQVTSTVNDTVNKVDETALGGALDNGGVTDVTEGVVNGTAGPESTVGKVADGAVDTVGGLLGGKP